MKRERALLAAAVVAVAVVAGGCLGAVAGIVIVIWTHT